MTRGRLLVVEGLEGSGKSTAIKILAELLTKQGIPYLSTREPGGTALGESLRQILKNLHEPLDPRAELLLFYAARVELIKQVIVPALAKGIWILADRFELSSLAYQGGGRGVDRALLRQLSASCVENMSVDCMIYMDISPELGLERALKRGQLDRIEQEPLEFFQAVQAAYQAEINTYPNRLVIDASQNLEQVALDLKQGFEAYLLEHPIDA